MAEITKQFLTGNKRHRQHEEEQVELEVSAYTPYGAKRVGNESYRAVVTMKAADTTRQYLRLAEEDVANLCVSLLRCLRTDAEVNEVLRTFFHIKPSQPAEMAFFVNVSDKRVRTRTASGRQRRG
jgi:hypothetical protein